MKDYDVVIIGSGIGGGSVATALAPTGARILILERGERLPREPQNSDPESVFIDLRYRSAETWYDRRGQPFRPGQYYYVGGATKMYGAAMFRFRVRDFEAVEHEEGISPAWPISYSDLEPWYAQAERIFKVHGEARVDPTEPPRSGPYPHPAVPHEPVMQWVYDGLKRQGLHPFPMPLAIDLGLPDAKCIRCNTCDAFPCQWGAKSDGETCLIDPVLRYQNVTLQTGSQVKKLLTDDTGRKIVAAEVEHKGTTEQIQAPLFILSAGAIQSSILLLRSATSRHPEGLANSSDQVGRNFMNHNCTAFMSIMPFRPNETHLPKTLSLNDYYFGGDASKLPLGNLQMLGKILEPMLRGEVPRVPRPVRSWHRPPQRRLVRHVGGPPQPGESGSAASRRVDRAALAADQPEAAPPVCRGGPQVHQAGRIHRPSSPSPSARRPLRTSAGPSAWEAIRRPPASIPSARRGTTTTSMSWTAASCLPPQPPTLPSPSPPRGCASGSTSRRGWGASRRSA